LIQSSELVQGIDTSKDEREQKKVEQRESLTFAEVLSRFVNDDASRDFPLRPRTRADYLNMIRPASGRRFAGELASLADKSVYRLDGRELKATFNALRKRGETRAAYAMQIANDPSQRRRRSTIASASRSRTREIE